MKILPALNTLFSTQEKTSNPFHSDTTLSAFIGNIPVTRKSVSDYLTNTQQSAPDIRQLATQLNLQWSLPFHQASYGKLINLAYPEVTDAMVFGTPKSGLCMGLALEWLSQRTSGKTDNDFHLSLLSLEDDAALLRVVSLQDNEQYNAIQTVVERYQATGKLDNTTQDNAKAEITEKTAASTGFSVIKCDDQALRHRLPREEEPLFNKELESIVDNAPIEQAFIIESKSHAMGLMKEADNSMSFFDPNCGVVSATPANREQLYALMDFILMKVQPDTRLPIFATEMNTQRSHTFPINQTTRNAL